MKDRRKTNQKWLEYQREYYKTNRERILALAAARREALKQKAQKEEELLQYLIKNTKRKNSTIAMIEAWNERLRQRLQEVEEQWLVYALQQQIICNETYAKHLEALGKDGKTNED